VLVTRQGTRVEKRILRTAADLVATLRDGFNLDVPEAATLWPAICARHEALFAGDTVPT
jgi:N-hydroxyarylamine O-acetyltransferase